MLVFDRIILEKICEKNLNKNIGQFLDEINERPIETPPEQCIVEQTKQKSKENEYSSKFEKFP